MELFNIISGIASIVSLIVSLFVASKVITISNKFNLVNNSNDSKNITQRIHGDRNTQIGKTK